MTLKTCVFTSIAANYLPKARVLAESIKRVAPEAEFYLMLVDRAPPNFNLKEEPFDSVISVADLDIDAPEAWCFSHRVVELCTAVKGMAACYLLDKCSADKVFYFDPDMVIYGRFDELERHLDTTSILLTPHQSEPETTIDAIMDNEMASLKHGVFNLGFIGIRNDEEGKRFAEWWSERLKTFCLDDIERGLFTDQKWANLVPCFFERYRVLRSPAFNVATWNISTREVEGDLERGITVNGEPLGFYHFSGFDSGDQALMLNKYAPSNSILFAMRNWYISECENKDQQHYGQLPYGYGEYECGESITQPQRDLYRVRQDLQLAFPNPFKMSPEGGYLAWFKANAEDGSHCAQQLELSDSKSIKDAISEFSQWLSQRAAHTSTKPKRYLVQMLASCLQLTCRLGR